MPKMITYGNEMLRLSSDAKKIEYSTNKGQTWSTRCTHSTSNGNPIELIDFGSELLLLTNLKLLYSSNKGLTWSTRCTHSTSNGNPQTIMDAGNELLLTTDKKLLYSTNKGLTWSVRKNL